jgi:3-dehydroquinate dehydratase-1
MPLVVAAIMEKDRRSFLRAIDLAGEVDIIEARVDGLAHPDAEKATLLLESIKATGKKAILTNRMKVEGGAFEGVEKERLKILESCLATADYVDLELRMRGLKKFVAKAKRADTGVIISAHDFSGTPGKKEMLSILKKEFKAGADIAKLAAKANSVDDVLTMLSVTRKASEIGDVCTISMGAMGKLSRVAAPFFGSVLTYGYVTKPTVPGQLSIAELKQALRILEV